ncbi:MAG TPA: MBL fold metallo-hydrolase [Gammaproteobacteria bacterium]|nr:MBL fold metallo-hydrolase [Gammaproteobacteria bacterium]
MSDAYLRFWGVRGSYAAPFASHLGVGGNTSCVEIRVNDHILVCDAGTGIISFGNEMMKQDKIRELMIVLTHYHWDHVCGLPFFVPAFMPDWKIRFFGPGQDEDEIRKHVSAQMRAPYFPVGTESWLSDTTYLNPKKDRTLHYGPIEIRYDSVHHPGVTYGYRIKVNGKVVIYISDNECKFIEKSVTKRQGEFNEEETTLYNEMVQEEHQSELDLIKNADILIHDAQYTPEDYEKKRGWGHSCYIDTINMAIDAGVKELYLYHHDPYYNDDAIEVIYTHSNQIISERDTDMICHIAREGMKIDL